MMKVFLLTLCMVFFSTFVYADYCSEERWRKNQRHQNEFSSVWRTQYANYTAQRDRFKTMQLLHRQYSAREMEASCRDTPEDCRKMFEQSAETIEMALTYLRKDIEALETCIQTGAGVIDEWHVLAGACHERNADNLKRGRENAAKVRTDLQKARQFLFEMRLMYFIYQQEVYLLQHIENVLQKMKAEDRGAPSADPP